AAEREGKGHAGRAGNESTPADAGVERAIADVYCHGLSLPSSTLDGAYDARICAAAADVAVHVGNDLLPRRLLVRRDQCCRLHDLPGLAVSALRHLLGDPRFLQRMLAVRREAFDCGDFPAGDLRHRNLAGAHCLAIDVDGAGAAEAGSAAELCA